MQQFSTPMMKQYEAIKKQYQDCLLFYRMGDFYELFLEDALIGSQVLNITLTSRPKGKDGRIPMAGVPYHAVDSYLAKLVKAGYKVAICEQLSPPNARGIIQRDVVRIVTPGTMLDEKALENKENNYIVSLVMEGNTLALSSADLSTGFFSTQELQCESFGQTIANELARIKPAECILPEYLYNDPEILKMIKADTKINLYPFLAWDNFAADAEKYLLSHFKVGTLAGFGISDMDLGLQSAAALLGYLKTTQKADLSHIKKITTFANAKHMMLDRSTMINLELFSTIRDHDTRGALLSVMDQTVTSMGGRLLKQWLKNPLVSKEAILNRHDAVELFFTHRTKREQLRDMQKQVIDIERILSRLSVGIGNARDLVNLKLSLQKILEIKQFLAEENTTLLKQISQAILSDIAAIIAIIETNIVDEPPIDLKIGGLIKQNISQDLDRIRKTVSGSKQWIAELEKTEREKTGISSLKVRFNKVFGFYIEISKSNLSAVPNYFMRKQTLVNGERFITPELKEHEEIILTAQEGINELEYQLFCHILEQVLSYTTALQDAAEAIAELDCLTSFAYLAEKENYVRPKLLYSGEIKIKNGRHPVVEKLLDQDLQFVPNDVSLNNIDHALLLITGPNMAGKSVLIRQVALIVLMNQIGSFVPAEAAYLSIVDRIFVRSGASDVITSGLSTFMVEMVETAHILHTATKHSLIVMDEIGRGTSTYDGISIAWAVAEFLATHTKPAPKVLFATHYHELQALEEQYPGLIRNFHMAVEEKNGTPIFLHTILPGGASHSFGVAVAKLAGVPEQVIDRAKEMLQTLEQRSMENTPRQTFTTSVILNSFQDSITNHKPIPIKENQIQDTLANHLIQKELEGIDIHQMTPLEALNKLAELKDKLKLFQQNQQVLEAD